MREVLVGALTGYDHFILAYFVALNSGYILLCVLSYFEIHRHLRAMEWANDGRFFRSGLAPSISVICPAYNEEATIVASLQSLLTMEYPHYEVVVVNDGSSDATLEILKRAYSLHLAPRAPSGELPTQAVRGIYKSPTHPNLVVVDKANGGKADALNAGINFTRNPLFCAIDADSMLEPDALLKLVRPFVDDPTTVAAGGVVRIVNGSRIENARIVEARVPKSHLARFQVVEYFRAFLFGRVGWAYFNALPIVSGAFGIFQRNTALAVGGYHVGSIGEDMELVLRIHAHCRREKRPYRIRFVPEPVCWTECPESVRILASQRNRWQRGLMDSLLATRSMLLNPRYGFLGLVTMPFFFFFEMLGPVFEALGLVAVVLSLALGLVDWHFAGLFFAVAVLLGIVLSLASLVLEGLTYRRYPSLSAALLLAAYGVAENFGYRQLHTFWRLRGIVDRLRGSGGWGSMKRTGLAVNSDAPTPAVPPYRESPTAPPTERPVEEVLAIVNAEPAGGPDADPVPEPPPDPREALRAEAAQAREELDRVRADVETALAALRRRLAEASARCERAEARWRAETGPPLPARVRWIVEPEGDGVAVQVAGRDDTREVLPWDAVRVSPRRAAYDYTERRLGPRTEIGDKGGSLARRLARVLADGNHGARRRPEGSQR